MADTGRIKSNIDTMITKGATEDEIDTYIASEGVTTQDLAAPQAPDVNTRLQEMFSDPNVPIEQIGSFLTENGTDITGQEKALADYATWKRSPEGQNYQGPKVVNQLPSLTPEAPAEQAAPALPPAPPKDPGLINGTMNSILEGAFPNLSNNSRGIDAAALNAWGALTGDEEFAPGKAFDEAYAQTELDKEAFSELHPTMDNVGTAVGFTGGFAAPMTKIGQAPKAAALLTSAGRKAALKYGVVNGAATGALYGAGTGALNASGDGRASNAFYGAQGGTAIGATMAPVVRGVTGAASWSRRNIPGINGMAEKVEGGFNRLTGRTSDLPAAQQHAQRLIAEEMDANKISTGMGTGTVPVTADNLADEITRRNDLGTPAMPADTSEQLRRLTSWSLQGRGPSTTRARQALQARQANQGARVRQQVQAEMKGAVDPIQATEDIVQRARAEAGPNYKQAYSEGVVLTPEIQEVMSRPGFRRQLQDTYDTLLDEGTNPAELGMYLDADGLVTLGDAPSLEALDTFIKTTRQGLPKNPLTGRVDTSGNKAAYSADRLTTDLDRLLRGQNSAFDVAKKTFADDMAIRDAMQRGGDVGKLSGHEINAQIRTMPDHAQEAWMTGASTALADKAVKVGQQPTANVAQAIRRDVGLSGAGMAASGGDQVKVQALDAMSGRPGSIARLDDRLEVEDQAFKTFGEAMLGSKTQPKAAMDENVSSGIARTARDVAFGNVGAALTTMLFSASGRGSFRFKQEVQDYIADTLTQTNPKNIREAFKAIEARAEKDNNFKAILNRAGIQLSRISASALGGADGDPYDPTQ